jgi:rsbT co-antagonist protein RsbR
MSDQDLTRDELLAELGELRERITGLERQLAESQQAEEALRATEATLRSVTIEQQQLIDGIRAISTPVIPVHDEIIVLPLVGTIDTTRAEQIMETLLTGVQRYTAEIVILDITGVPVVDTAIANHLIQAMRAATLLGARCVLVGISAEVAQLMVQLGVNIGNITTCSNLQAGITYALDRLGRAITVRDEQNVASLLA